MTLQKSRLVVAGTGAMMAAFLGLAIFANGNWFGARTAVADSSPSSTPPGTSTPFAASSPSSTPLSTSSTRTTTTTRVLPSPTKPRTTPSGTLRGAKVWLEIPSIDVDHRVTARGLVGGKINPSARQLIWFTGSGRVQPGKVGTAVIAGHIIANGVPDVFYHLDRLHKGSVVRLRDADGRTLKLTVVQTLTVDKTALQTNQTIWGGNTTVRRVALVTCDDALGLRPDGHRVANFVAIAEPG
jgi:LPXTG-site transpeptidase (sortase) family protein